MQFGQPRRLIRDPGLYAKRPFIENVIYYDRRLLDFEPPPEEIIASEQKRLVVDTYTRYSITNPLLFYQTVNSEEGGTRPPGSAGQRQPAAGDRQRHTVRHTVGQSADIMQGQICDEVREEAKPFGIDVIDVRIRRADLPPENSQAIYARMTLRARAAGRPLPRRGRRRRPQTVRANADRERTVILADAQRDAQRGAR